MQNTLQRAKQTPPKLRLCRKDVINSAFTCSSPTIKLLEKIMKYMLKVNNRNTRTASLTLLWCLFSNFEQIFFFFCSVSIDGFEPLIDLKGVCAPHSRNIDFPVPFLNIALTIHTTQKMKFSIKVFFS